MNITDGQADYVQKLVKELQDAGIRAKADLRNEKIGFKIREHTLRRVPYMLVCGDKKLNQAKWRFVLVEEKTLAVSTLTNLKKSFCKKLEAEVFISWRNKVLKAEKEFNQRVRIASMVRFALMKFV